ncbi:MAG: type III-I CRISPR precrRNA processing endoribonuclease Cas6 [Ardenticatenaceae bacterium]
MSISSLPNSINLIRYLLIWRVNHSLVRLPSSLPAELSLVLGKIIAERLPTHQARPWRKALEPWDECDLFALDRRRDKNDRTIIPEISWPIENVLFVYPGKRTYGHGEFIFSELKLLGSSADHNLFLEVILPAIEEASLTSDSRWKRSNKLWGRFDIHSIHVARGVQWEPLTTDGRLDLNAQVTPSQWSEGLIFDIAPNRTFKSLKWITPFDLTLEDNRQAPNDRSHKPPMFAARPTLSDIFIALISRANSIISDKPTSYSSGWDLLSEEEQKAVREALAQIRPMFTSDKNIKRAPKNVPGRLIGTQRFRTIPAALIPYLQLASILHIGKYTHFGCGTFSLS